MYQISASRLKEEDTAGLVAGLGVRPRCHLPFMHARIQMCCIDHILGTNALHGQKTWYYNGLHQTDLVNPGIRRTKEG